MTSRELPPEIGTSTIPEGELRLYHQTDPDNLAEIRKHGLSLDSALGIEGPKAVWATSGKPFYNGNSMATVEFHLPPGEVRGPSTGGAERVIAGKESAEDWNGVSHVLAMNRNVSPAQFSAIHEPWHHHARYMEDNPDIRQRVLSGEHDDLTDDPNYGPAVAYIKGKYGR